MFAVEENATKTSSLHSQKLLGMLGRLASRSCTGFAKHNRSIRGASLLHTEAEWDALVKARPPQSEQHLLFFRSNTIRVSDACRLLVTWPSSPKLGMWRKNITACLRNSASACFVVSVACACRGASHWCRPLGFTHFVYVQ